MQENGSLIAVNKRPRQDSNLHPWNLSSALPLSYPVWTVNCNAYKSIRPIIHSHLTCLMQIHFGTFWGKQDSRVTHSEGQNSTRWYFTRRLAVHHSLITCLLCQKVGGFLFSRIVVLPPWLGPTFLSITTACLQTRLGRHDAGRSQTLSQDQVWCRPCQAKLHQLILQAMHMQRPSTCLCSSWWWAKPQNIHWLWGLQDFAILAHRVFLLWHGDAVIWMMSRWS